MPKTSDAARALGRRGGKANTPAQRAARLANISNAHPSTRLSWRKERVRQRARDAAADLGLPIRDFGFGWEDAGPRLGVLMETGAETPDLQWLLDELVERKVVPDNTTIIELVPVGLR